MSVILFLLIGAQASHHGYFQWPHTPSHPPGVAQGSEWDVPLDLGSITSTWRLEDCGKYKLPGNWVKQMMECNIIVQLKRTFMYICKCPKRPKILHLASKLQECEKI